MKEEMQEIVALLSALGRRGAAAAAAEAEAAASRWQNYRPMSAVFSG
jgi:hypothetical protein